MKIKWIQQYHTSQVYSSGVEMALASAKDEQIGPWVFCKDFFQDAVKGFLTGTASQIWGYHYSPKTDPQIDVNNIRILMGNSGDSKFNEKLPNILDFLNQMEKSMGLSLTKGYLTDSPPADYSKGGVVYLVGDGAWMRSSAALSMYALFARNGGVHKIGRPYMETVKDIMSKKLPGGVGNDAMYFEYGLPGINLVIAKGIDKVFGKDIKENYLPSVNTHTIHHKGGIVSFGTGECAKTWKHWLKPEEKFGNVPSVLFA